MVNHKILIVDDNADTRLLLSMQLKAHGYRTVFAADALEAIMMAREARPDLMLLDLGLPKSNGFLVLERLKAIPELAAIPVIIVSAEEPKVAQLKTMMLGAEGFLQKPVEQRSLVEAVEQALTVHRGATEGGI